MCNGVETAIALDVSRQKPLSMFAERANAVCSILKGREQASEAVAAKCV
jgi:hypothetical protein